MLLCGSDLVEEGGDGVVAPVQDEQQGRHFCLSEVKQLVLLGNDLLCERERMDNITKTQSSNMIYLCHGGINGEDLFRKSTGMYTTLETEEHLSYHK